MNISYIHNQIMNEIYMINDKRTINHMKERTFSGYKKTDVINQVFKSMESKKIEATCFWITECLVSGYIVTLFEKLINYGGKLSINNPSLPSFLKMKHDIFYNQLNHLKHLKKEAPLYLRNSIMIRNMFFDIATTYILTPFKKKYEITKKIKEEDLKFEKIQNLLSASMNVLPETFIHFTDPPELRILMNELLFLFKNKQVGYDRCLFWIQFLQKWETLHKKKKNSWNISPRKVNGISEKQTANFIWIIWEIIFYELQSRRNLKVKQQIDCLYELFKYNYSSGKRNTRLPLVYWSIALLIFPCDFSKPVRSDYRLFIQSQSNLQKMFQMKKTFEQVNEGIQLTIPVQPKNPPKRNKKKEINYEIEIIQDKVSLFNELDKQIMGKYI